MNRSEWDIKHPKPVYYNRFSVVQKVVYENERDSAFKRYQEEQKNKPTKTKPNIYKKKHTIKQPTQYNQSLQELKNALTWEQVAEEYGILLRGGSPHYSQINCLFHDDNTPSLTLYYGSKTYKCYGCGASGDILAFITHMEDESN
jgi:hypothetical protein